LFKSQEYRTQATKQCIVVKELTPVQHLNTLHDFFNKLNLNFSLTGVTH